MCKGKYNDYYAKTDRMVICIRAVWGNTDKKEYFDYGK